MSVFYAVFNGSNLPPQFSYTPYIARKRKSVVATAGAVITQTAETTQIIHGDSYIDWTCPGIFATEYATLRSLYETAAETEYTFTGYWGDSFTVYLDSLSSPFRGRIGNASGRFQVLAVLTNHTALTCQ